MYIYLLSKQDLYLSSYEIACLSDNQEFERDEDLLLGPEVPYRRLAYTKSVFEIICQIDEIEEYELPEGSFAARVLKAKKTEEELASLIWHNLKIPKVNLKNPRNDFYLIKDMLCLKKWDNNNGFESRKSHLRPENHPTSLHPRLARCLVNILNKGSFLDPFCGAGGILIEGGLAGCHVKGMDIDPIMIKRAKINLKHFGIEAEIKKGDATKLTEKTEGIVTDLPYGRNSKLENDTYEKFMVNAKEITKRLVTTVPADSKVSLHGWNLEKEFTYYLHKSLSKRILVLSC